MAFSLFEIFGQFLEMSRANGKSFLTAVVIYSLLYRNKAVWFYFTRRGIVSSLYNGKKLRVTVVRESSNQKPRVRTLVGARTQNLKVSSGYRKNAQAVSEAYRDRPATALETAVWWTEYIARGKGLPFLRSASANLSWFQYHLLDVIAFLSLVTLVFLFVTVFAIKLIFRSLFGSKAPVVRTEKSNGPRKNGVDKKRV